jgi:hypothetical protein
MMCQGFILTRFVGTSIEKSLYMNGTKISWMSLAARISTN